MTRPDDPTAAPLTRLETVGLGLLAVAVAGFGYLVVLRSAYQTERKTDFGVYARAGYAVRTGLDLYDKSLCDDRGWHYCYPPTFAVLMAPLADPFQYDYGRVPGSYLPFGVSVTVWFALNVLLTAWAVHVLVKATLPAAVPGSRLWWYARMIPTYVCLSAVGNTLSRGQVNLLLVALVAGMFAASARGRWVTAGVWLAGAVTLKIIPAFLALYPAVVQLRGPGPWGQRVGGLARTVAGTILGLVVIAGVIPSLVWGVDGSVRLNVRVVDVVLAPGATGGGDQTRAKELTGATATDSQAFQAAFHNLQHPNNSTRPPEVAPHTRLAHWAAGGLMTLVTVAVGWWRLRSDPADRLIFLGGLTVVMLLVTPVSHMHYYAMVLPLAVGLTTKGYANRPGTLRPAPRVLVPLALWGVWTTALLIPNDGVRLVRDLGGATFATVALWAVGVREMTLLPWAERQKEVHRGGRRGRGEKTEESRDEAAV